MKVSEVLVVGGSGFIGRHLVASLAAAGIRVTVPSRRRERAKHLILLPTVDVVEADVMAPGVLERLTAGKHAVYNLVGILHSRRGRGDERGPNDYGPDFARMHVELPQAIVAACRATSVRRFLHISALGAAPDAPSEYLRSKGIGEKAVLAAEDLDVTVFRPSVVFGPEDKFLNEFARMARFLPGIAVPCPEARFQPVYVGDVARALHFALEEPEARGRAYELCGPRVYTLKELVETVCAITGRRRMVTGLPDRLSYFQAWILEHLPGKLMTRDNYRSMQVPNTCDAAFPFGLHPQALEAVAPAYLAPSGGPAGPRERYLQLRWRARR
jgi:NADH dehydrogenase